MIKTRGRWTLSSTLPGTFRWKAKADAYGDSNYVDVTFIGDNLSALNAVIYQVKAAKPCQPYRQKKISTLRSIMLTVSCCGATKIKTMFFQMSEQLTEEEMAL
ncbi:intimin [Salmonella enterica subsp. enterica]|uniref:Intimin n=1 Tax=Salmonella enterica I TaxID=59201 RepID=A0A379VMK4_SALET|nr:intimin [Salmonella enterica subsp. enterica]